MHREADIPIIQGIIGKGPRLIQFQVVCVNSGKKKKKKKDGGLGHWGKKNKKKEKATTHERTKETEQHDN